MNVDRHGHADEVSYVRTFSRSLAPPLLRAAAALNGFEPPPADDFDYCELGSGSGDTTATLAAANPRARFLGVDMLHTHIAASRDLARRGGLDNVRFIEGDFEDLDGAALPAFDYITAHGLLSWISPAKRRALVTFAGARLKPGGLLFVSYNALPGWAAVEPLRRLMVEGSAGEGDTLDRARRGVALARMLADVQAGYFTQNPITQTMLETLSKAGLPYVVHEYFQPHWHAMYVSDLAREMAEGDLHFVGQLPLYLNYGDLSVPPAAMKLLAGVKDRLVFESLKDYALNEFFRRDVYVKGSAGHAAGATEAYLDTTPFGTLVPPSRIQRSVRLPHYTVEFDGPIFDALLATVAEQPASALELAGRPDLAAFDLARIRETLSCLLLGDDVGPMHPATLAVAPAPRGRLCVPSAYNRMILAQDLGTESVVVLAAPAAGTGLVSSGSDLAALRALTGVAAASQEIGADEVERFRVEQAPKLVQLGVLGLS
jgi:SAM-dependent methyltransferase